MQKKFSMSSDEKKIAGSWKFHFQGVAVEITCQPNMIIITGGNSCHVIGEETYFVTTVHIVCLDFLLELHFLQSNGSKGITQSWSRQVYL